MGNLTVHTNQEVKANIPGNRPKGTSWHTVTCDSMSQLQHLNPGEEWPDSLKQVTQSKWIVLSSVEAPIAPKTKSESLL